MNKANLKKAAEDLEEVLIGRNNFPSSLDRMKISLMPMIRKAQRMEIDCPVDENTIPGAFQFNEGTMRDFPDLEEAYVEFRIQISGGVSSEMQEILESMEKRTQD